MTASAGATVQIVATPTTSDIGTIALADQLNHLRARVPLSETTIARATGVDEPTVREWIERRSAPTGVHANRLNELIAVVDEMAANIKPDSIAEWLEDEIPALGGEVPADVIAGGGYERVMSIALWLSYGGLN